MARRALSAALLLVGVPTGGAQRVEVEPGCTAVGECAPCTVTQKDEWFCLPTGFSQDVTCADARGWAAGSANTTKTVSCTSRDEDGVGKLLRFELMMVVLFGLSFAMTNRRKARLMSLQHSRISQYLDA